jgi:hypothetical protein
MADRTLEEIANDLANRAKAEGCRGVIVAVSKDQPSGHSSFHVEHRGPCLELEGLKNRISGVIRKLWKGLVKHRAA